MDCGTQDQGEFPEPDHIVSPFEKEMHDWFGTPEWYDKELSPACFGMNAGIITPLVGGFLPGIERNGFRNFLHPRNRLLQLVEYQQEVERRGESRKVKLS